MKNRELLNQIVLGKKLSRREQRLIVAGGPGIPPKLPPKGQCTVQPDPYNCQQWLQNCIASATNPSQVQACYIEYHLSYCDCLQE